ncbi:NAD(P)/FAD-dependent oxidoreductase [Streptomyces tendae]
MDTPNTSSERDSIVVGGSAAGLSAALMLGRAGRDVLVIDSGSPRNRFADHMHGVLGHEGTPPTELVRQGRAETAEYGTQFLADVVERVDDTGAGLVVTTSGGREMRTRSLIVATGVTDVLPDVPGLAPRWGVDVLHCPYCHGWEVRGQRIGVLATSPASLHQARMVRQWSDKVTFFSAAAGTLDHADVRSLSARGIRIVEEPAAEVVVEGDRITGIRTADGQVTAIDAMFTTALMRPHDQFLAGLDLNRTDSAPGGVSLLTVDGSGKTSHPRIWAVGNVVNPGANVPMVMGAGSFTGTAVNGWLVEDDFDQALANSVL